MGPPSCQPRGGGVGAANGETEHGRVSRRGWRIRRAAGSRRISRVADAYGGDPVLSWTCAFWGAEGIRSATEGSAAFPGGAAALARVGA
ncbi:hypothetical protein NL676_025329 [Syzygium grande]|nr:hypothetical protein NL676_025329 [Syzygium grande]